MLRDDVAGQRRARGRVLDLDNLRACRVAGVVAHEVGDVGPPRRSNVAGEHQVGGERSERCPAEGVHVGHRVNEQVAGADLNLVPFITKALEVRTTTYQ